MKILFLIIISFLIGLTLFGEKNFITSKFNSINNSQERNNTDNKINMKNRNNKGNKGSRAGETLVINNGSMIVTPLIPNFSWLNIDGDLAVQANGLFYSENSIICNSETTFYGPEGIKDAVIINPSANLDMTTVTNYSGKYPSAPNSISHWWIIEPTEDRQCDIEFRMRDSDIPVEIVLSDLRIWEFYDSAWTELSTGSPTSGTPFTGFTSLSFSSVNFLISPTEHTITLTETESPIPVILSSFTAIYSDNKPNLCWITQSEIDNSGWNIYRSESENIIESFQVNGNLIQGAGTSTEPTEYKFADEYEVYSESTYHYWLESINFSGTTKIYGPISLTIPSNPDPENNEIPLVYGLHQNFPNPIAKSTTISFIMKDDCNGSLSIYNVKGQKIKTLIQKNELIKDKLIKVNWNGRDETGKEAVSGIYFYKLETENKNYLKKMILLR